VKDGVQIADVLGVLCCLARDQEHAVVMLSEDVLAPLVLALISHAWKEATALLLRLEAAGGLFFAGALVSEDIVRALLHVVGAGAEEHSNSRTLALRLFHSIAWASNPSLSVVAATVLLESDGEDRMRTVQLLGVLQKEGVPAEVLLKAGILSFLDDVLMLEPTAALRATIDMLAQLAGDDAVREPVVYVIRLYVIRRVLNLDYSESKESVCIVLNSIARDWRVAALLGRWGFMSPLLRVLAGGTPGEKQLVLETLVTQNILCWSEYSFNTGDDIIACLMVLVKNSDEKLSNPALLVLCALVTTHAQKIPLSGIVPGLISVLKDGRTSGVTRVLATAVLSLLRTGSANLPNLEENRVVQQLAQLLSEGDVQAQSAAAHALGLLSRCKNFNAVIVMSGTLSVLLQKIAVSPERVKLECIKAVGWVFCHADASSQELLLTDVVQQLVEQHKTGGWPVEGTALPVLANVLSAAGLGDFEDNRLTELISYAPTLEALRNGEAWHRVLESGAERCSVIETNHELGYTVVEMDNVRFVYDPFLELRSFS
jgi:hypothetical protein